MGEVAPLARGDYDRAVAFAVGDWRVVVAPRAGSTTVALRWLVAAGGEHDGARPGLSHLTQRLVFRDAHASRPDLTAALDHLGGHAASRTTREYAEFHAVVPAPGRAALLALIPALARPPSLDADACARQRQAILVELAALAPERVVWDLVHEALWGDHPLARPPEGTAPSVGALTPTDVAAHHAACYGPRRTVLALAGACTVAQARAAVMPLARGRRVSAGAPETRPPPSLVAAGARYRWAPGDLVHLAVAVPAPGMTHPHRSTLRLLDYVLGRGGSSRLYRELRERRGLVYSCGSLYMPYATVGLLVARATCAATRAREVADALAACMLGLADAPPTDAEVRGAQRRYVGALHRGLESNASLASLLAVEALLSEHEPFATTVARAEAVTAAEVAAITRATLQPSRLVRACVGPVDPGEG